MTRVLPKRPPSVTCMQSSSAMTADARCGGSIKNLQVHHLQFRSQSGHDDEMNLITPRAGSAASRAFTALSRFRLKSRSLRLSTPRPDARQPS
jgi:hypothetical protein